MKKITYFHLTTCPYCAQANKAIEELKKENPAYEQLEIDMINEVGNEDLIAKYDYHAVPCMWIGDQKIYEAHLFEKYDECKAMVKKVFDLAME